MVVQPPKFEFYDPQSPIYTSPRFLPPAKIVDSKICDAIISHGAFLEECSVDNAIVGLRSRIGKNATIKASAVHLACVYLPETKYAAQTSCHICIACKAVGTTSCAMAGNTTQAVNQLCARAANLFLDIPEYDCISSGFGSTLQRQHSVGAA